MNKTTPNQSDYCRLKVAHHLRENLVLSLVAVSVVLVFRYLTSGEAERVDRRQPAVTELGLIAVSIHTMTHKSPHRRSDAQPH